MKSISRTQYLEILGLLTLAQNHVRQLQDIEAAVRAIVAEDDNFGHSSDAVWDSGSPEPMAKELLSKLGITVSK